MTTRKLLVFEMNGVLCLCKSIYDTSINKIVVYSFNCSYHFDRNLANFLNLCNKYFDICIWTSSTESKIINSIEYIKSIIDFELKFVWYCHNCLLDNKYKKNSTTPKWLTIKDINSILLSPYINFDRFYTIDNIIIVDNNERKVESFKYKIIPETPDLNKIMNEILLYV